MLSVQALQQKRRTEEANDARSGAQPPAAATAAAGAKSGGKGAHTTNLVASIASAVNQSVDAEGSPSEAQQLADLKAVQMASKAADRDKAVGTPGDGNEMHD